MGRAPEWAFVVVLVALASLIVVPLVTIQRTAALRDRVSQVVEPARARVGEIQSAVAIESGASRWYAMTGAAEAVSSHEEARAFGNRALAQLGPLAAQLAPEVGAALDTLTQFLQSASATVDSLYSGAIPRDAYARRIGQRQARLQEAMSMATSLERAIGRAANADVARVRSIERGAAVATIALVGLALIAAVLVGILARRYRDLATRQTQLHDELRRVGESHTRLIRGFTHDVKNPLGAADGFLALMEEGVHGELSVVHREKVSRVRRLIRAALKLIGDLLEIERASSGRLEIHIGLVNLTATTNDVVESFRAQAAAKSLTLSSSREPRERVIIESDQDRLRQVVANLISNAVKYTPSGGRVEIDIGIERPPHGAMDKSAVVTVKDNGPGIPAEKQAMLFREFTRFDPGAAQGSGIGLAISQRVARALGGQITLVSEAGQGCTFKLWLPLAHS